MAAMEAVLNTTELLEAILLQLPGQELLHMQLVCDHWRKVMHASVALCEHCRNRVLIPAHQGGSSQRIPTYEDAPEIAMSPVLRRIGLA